LANATASPSRVVPPPGESGVTVRLHPLGPRPGRFFVLAIALPTVLAYLAFAGVVAVCLGVLARDFDRQEDNRAVAAMHLAFSAFLNQLVTEVADDGTWDEAYFNTVTNSNLAFMDGSWGATVRLATTYDMALVTDAAGNIVFGEDGSGPVSGNIGDLFPSATTLLAELDRGIADTGDATTVSRFALGKPGLVGLAGISIHQAATDKVTVPRQARRILWFARLLTPTLLREITSYYQTPVPALVERPDGYGASLRLVDADGNAAGIIAWTPDEPGRLAIGQVLPSVLGAFAALALALLVALLLLRRTMLGRADLLERRFVALTRAAPVVAEQLEALPPAFPMFAEGASSVSAAVEGVSAFDLDIAYQPIFDLRSETLVGAEALMRWRQADGTPVLEEELSPADAAYLRGRAGILGLRRGIDEIAPLLGLSLTVAVSPSQFEDDAFAEKIAATLGATGFPPARLELAIGVAGLKTLAPLAAATKPLRALGIAIAFSDFVLSEETMDYAESGLASRIRLPRGLVAGIDTDKGRFALAEATIGIAKATGLAITVPGVERHQQALLLLRLGCGQFQGGLLAAPLPIAGLTALVLAPPSRKVG
jgi:EAL domain-containing protein (putative c-di-GMP-specific phosphodiesterase class I)/sensor domain CHASE-containing protein